ncbi:hypothetical protein RB201_03980 [Streptomyces sp. S1A(2023)]
MYIRTRTAVAALLLTLMLTACADGEGKSGAAGSTTRSGSAKAKVDCGQANLSEADWVEHCSDAQGSNGASAKAPELVLGQPATTVGDGGVGELEVTPTTLVYAKDGGGESSEYGTFAVLTVKDKATNAVAAQEPPPISGGGWKWIAADGEAVESGGGIAFNVVMDKFSNSGPVDPGSFYWRSVVFDLTPEQAEGGVLIYTDGSGSTFRWKMPATESGPQVAEVKKQLES